MFTPLLRKLPIVAGMQIYCFNDPDINFELTGVVDSANSYFIRGGLTEVLKNVLRRQLVLPRKKYICWTRDYLKFGIDRTALSTTDATGILHLTIVGCVDLYVGSLQLTRAISTMYVKVESGGQEFQSPTVPLSSKPTWNDFTCPILAFSLQQKVVISIYEHSRYGLGGTHDTLLGHCEISMFSILRHGERTLWSLSQSVRHQEAKATARIVTKVPRFGKRRARVLELLDAENGSQKTELSRGRRGNAGSRRGNAGKSPGMLDHTLNMLYDVSDQVESWLGSWDLGWDPGICASSRFDLLQHTLADGEAEGALVAVVRVHGACGLPKHMVEVSRRMNY